jgi:hypothetical protein
MQCPALPIENQYQRRKRYPMIKHIKLASSLTVGALVLILLGCDEDGLTSTETVVSDQQAGYTAAKNDYGRSDGTVIVPFKSHFKTHNERPAPDYRESCGDRPWPPYAQTIQVGSGEATHLGQFTTRGTFCTDQTAFKDGELSPGESLPYDNVWFVLTAANGDELWLTGGGEILPSDDPECNFEFFDPFEFAGGTGRFAGATGGGSMESCVLVEGGVYHEWDGELILPAGN